MRLVLRPHKGKTYGGHPGFKVTKGTYAKEAFSISWSPLGESLWLTLLRGADFPKKKVSFEALGTHKVPEDPRGPSSPSPSRPQEPPNWWPSNYLPATHHPERSLQDTEEIMLPDGSTTAHQSQDKDLQPNPYLDILGPASLILPPSFPLPPWLLAWNEACLSSSSHL